jgi:hypothetical protein
MNSPRGVSDIEKKKLRAVQSNWLSAYFKRDLRAALWICSATLVTDLGVFALNRKLREI